MKRLFQLVAVALVVFALAPAALALSACWSVDEHACCRGDSESAVIPTDAADCCVVKSGDTSAPSTGIVSPRPANGQVQLVASAVILEAPRARASHAAPAAAIDTSPHQAILCTFLN